MFQYQTLFHIDDMKKLNDLFLFNITPSFSDLDKKFIIKIKLRNTHQKYGKALEG